MTTIADVSASREMLADIPAVAGSRSSGKILLGSAALHPIGEPG